MSKKKPSSQPAKKLTIKKETLRKLDTLSDKQLGGVVGGVGGTTIKKGGSVVTGDTAC